MQQVIARIDKPFPLVSMLTIFQVVDVLGILIDERSTKFSNFHYRPAPRRLAWVHGTSDRQNAEH